MQSQYSRQYLPKSNPAAIFVPKMAALVQPQVFSEPRVHHMEKEDISSEKCDNIRRIRL